MRSFMSDMPLADRLDAMKFNQIDTHIEKYYKVSQPINQ
jgi:hypothetical protein